MLELGDTTSTPSTLFCEGVDIEGVTMGCCISQFKHFPQSVQQEDLQGDVLEETQKEGQGREEVLSICRGRVSSICTVQPTETK